MSRLDDIKRKYFRRDSGLFSLKRNRNEDFEWLVARVETLESIVKRTSELKCTQHDHCLGCDATQALREGEK